MFKRILSVALAIVMIMAMAAVVVLRKKANA